MMQNSPHHDEIRVFLTENLKMLLLNIHIIKHMLYYALTLEIYEFESYAALVQNKPDLFRVGFFAHILE